MRNAACFFISQHKYVCKRLRRRSEIAPQVLAQLSQYACPVSPFRKTLFSLYISLLGKSLNYILYYIYYILERKIYKKRDENAIQCRNSKREKVKKEKSKKQQSTQQQNRSTQRQVKSGNFRTRRSPFPSHRVLQWGGVCHTDTTTARNMPLTPSRAAFASRSYPSPHCVRTTHPYPSHTLHNGDLGSHALFGVPRAPRPRPLVSSLSIPNWA